MMILLFLLLHLLFVNWLLDYVKVKVVLLVNEGMLITVMATASTTTTQHC